MDRIPEPELMDDASQAAVYAGPHLDNACWLFIQWFRKSFPQLPGQGYLLDLGCGPAAIPVRLARLLPQWRIHGVDGSAAMLACGREAVHHEGLEDRVRLVQGVLPASLPLPLRRYGAVTCNSFLHHLADPQVLWQAIRRYGEPGAAVLVVDLLRPADEQAAERLIDTYVPEAPPMLRRDMLLSLRAAYTVEEVKAQLQQADLADVLVLKMVSPMQFAVSGHLRAAAGPERGTGETACGKNDCSNITLN